MINLTGEELIKLIEYKIDTGDFKDSVHKIKLITTKEMIREIQRKEEYCPSHTVWKFRENPGQFWKNQFPEEEQEKLD